MVSRSYKIMSAAALGVLLVGGYFMYMGFASQGQGALAQAPLNNQVQVAPAFIMAVDDSQSMTNERLLQGGDGGMAWNSANGSFFNDDGTLFNLTVGCRSNPPDCYLYLYSHTNYNQSISTARAIPPLDEFGFSRSHEYNASYFNPGQAYPTWQNADGSYWPDADINAARADPRDYGAPFSSLYGVTYDLTVNRANTGETFQMLNGMSIPSLSGRGVRYYRNGAWQTAAHNFTANQQIAFDYFPATFYLLENSPAPDGYRTGDAYRPVVANACGPGCNMRRYEIKLENYETSSHYDSAIQNFANWFQYHRNRQLAMVASMSYAFQDVNNMRVGYFTINNDNPYPDVTMHDINTERASFYDEFSRLWYITAGTKNRAAVHHLGEQFRRTGDDAPIQRHCQKNAGMLFTDGYTTRNTGPTSFGHVDQGLGSPFADDHQNTIADIVAKYYLDVADGGYAPLRTGLGAGGQVPVPDACWLDKAAGILDPDADPRLDCQPNLHLNFYGISLGMKGVIYDVDMGATDDPFANPPNWNASVNPRTVDGPETIDEIWHATINTRGEFISARTPADITEAMRRVLSSVSAGASPSGSVSLTGERVGSSSLYVVPRYEVRNDGTDWFSTLAAMKVELDEDTRVVSEEQVWEASQRIPSAESRNVWFGRNGGTEQFNSANSNISFSMLCSTSGMRICTGSEAEALGGSLPEAIDYLLGDTSREVGNPGGVFRFRSTRLGDIINSNPVVSAPTDDYGYGWLPSPYGSSYLTYLENKETSRNTMVYVGANAGMLHAIDSGMRADGTMVASPAARGRESFAYIPQAVAGHLGNLLFPHDPLLSGNQKFDHRYYVDGPLTVSDAYFDGSWNTVLVGTAGAGGRSVFSLDVTDPSSFTSSDRLWEINDQHANPDVRGNIGNVLGRPLVVPVKNTAGTVSWKAIFGNGYNSANQKAVLFVVDVDNPGNIHMLEAEETSATSPPAGSSNGLGNIIAVDRWGGTDLDLRIRDGFVDTVYGADQRGALWKFDLRSISMTGIVSTDLDAQPLFVTQTYTDGGQTYRQPILGGLTAVATHGGRLMIFFGTGSFSFYGDEVNASMQSLYAILDNEDGNTVALGDLHPREITATTGGARTISDTAMPFGTSGWYLNLPAGERFVGYPSILSGVVLMPTYSPDTTGGAGCSTSGFNWLYGLDARTGAAAMSDISFGSPDGPTQADGVGAVIADTGGSAPLRNVEVFVIPEAGLPEPPPPICDPDDPDCIEPDPDPPPVPPDAKCYARAVAGGVPPMYRPYFCGRMSWRQIQ